MQMEQILPAILQRRLPAGTEEIRLRSGCRPMAVVDGKSVYLDGDKWTPAQIKDVVDRACAYSIHSCQDQLAQGYLTIQGGHRMGVCGQAVMQQGQVQMMRNFSSVNLRVARQIVGAAQPVFPLCFRGDEPLSVLLFSPPGFGKTTLLRDLIRLFSMAGWRVGVADERAEICAMVQGQSQFDLGEQVDVITGCPKAQGAMMLLKTMSPQILAVDEITSPEDVQALGAVVNCGVRVLATIHAWSWEELRRKPLFTALERERFFDRVIGIRRQGGRRTYESKAWGESA